MIPCFAFTYFMKPDPEKIRHCAPSHADYWKTLALPGYHGGPFADHSGGLILFHAKDLPTAERHVQRDPFYRHRLLERHWLKEWDVQPHGQGGK